MTKMIVHHGSPGKGSDFAHLKNHLKTLDVIDYDRLLASNDKEITNADIQLGYSFGCVQAIAEAVKNKSTKLVILVAPYMFPEKKPGALMKALLLSDLFRNLALPVLAKKSIEKMIKESSHPASPPEHYIKDSMEYYNASRIAQSILEKEISHDDVYKNLQTLRDNNIPVIVIMGEGDQTCYKGINREKQFNPLLTLKNINIKLIQDAGHALLWTHTKDLAHIIEEAIGKNMTNKKFGYFDGINENNNVASFLKDHK